MIDLRQQFEEVLEEYGHPILLIRQNKRIEVPEPDELGLKYAYEIEKHMCRSQTAAIPETLPRMIRPEIPGMVSPASRMFYLKHDVCPGKLDLIAEVAWDGDTPIIDQYTFLYEINYPEPFRGQEGRIEYFRAACKVDPINATIKLRTIAGKQYISVIRGD